NGAITQRVAERSQKLLEGTISLAAAVRDVAFVSESIVERIAEKRALFAKLSKLLPPDVILSTNTSSLSLSPIAASVRFPERFVGLHWMNPAHLMPIVEVIRAPATSD